MQLIQTLKKKYLQAEQKVKQRTQAIDLLVSGQTAANQRSIANRDNIRNLTTRIETMDKYYRASIAVNHAEISLLRYQIQAQHRITVTLSIVTAISIVCNIVLFALYFA